MTTTTQPTTITVTDTATIISGKHTRYRYDLPQHAHQHHQAADAIIAELRAQNPTTWPDLCVTIDADPTTTATLSTALTTHGITVTTTHTPTPPTSGGRHRLKTPDAPTTPDADPQDTPPAARDRIATWRTTRTKRAPSRHRWRPRPTSRNASRNTKRNTSTPPRPTRTPTADTIRQAAARTWPIIGTATIITIVVGFTWIYGTRLHTTPTQNTTQKPTTSTLKTTTPHPATQQPHPQNNTHIEGPHFAITAPAGFALTATSPQSFTITNPDAGLRLLIDYENLDGAQPEEVHARLDQAITADPTLRWAPQPPTFAPANLPENDVLTYIENPADGTEVYWATWTTPTHHISLGCHVKNPAVTADTTRCAQAMTSFTHKE
ncbi:type VII secretion-associated protein [Corynebacterium aquilae]|uniref:type VII secretion-associated protein n=1 Tax=Corynebacterium aquilae TaxID=203263 RepID=UPI0009525B21|nr:type VII secretion-associated protein [Corynebacterium aquilae]